MWLDIAKIFLYLNTPSHLLLFNSLMYEARPESKDTSRVGRWGNFLCLLWQHWRRP
jgi:hypothetical protein